MTVRSFTLASLVVGWVLSGSAIRVAAAEPTAVSAIVTFTESQSATSASRVLGVPASTIHELLPTVFRVSGASFVASPREVQAVEGDQPIHAFTTPNDARFPGQVGPDQLSARSAWDYTNGTNSSILAIVDTGINGQHEDMAGRVMAGFDYVNNTTISAGADSDDHGHGTAIASVAAATGNNNVGLAGMNWQTRLMPVKVLDNTGAGTASQLISGIRYAADRGATVINLSLGGSSGTTSLEEAVNYAWNKGAVLIGASGNDSGTSVLYPAAYDRVLAVGSVTTGDAKSSFSTSGSALDLTAPGEGIMVATDSSAGYSTATGTSIAAGFVSGAATLIHARHPGKSNQEIVDALVAGADDVGGMNGVSRTDLYGDGRLNVGRSVSAAPNYQARWAGQSDYLTLAPGQSAQLQVRFLNTGRSGWYRDTPFPVRLGTSHDQDRSIPFTRGDQVSQQPSGWITPTRVQLTTSQVDPGSIGTFSFWITVPTGITPGTYREYFQPVGDGVDWLAGADVFWDIRVPPSSELYQATWGGQSPNPTLANGVTHPMVVAYKNTGPVTWTRGVVNLGLVNDDFSFGASTPLASNWLAPDRAARLDQASVAPGQVGTFTFQVANRGLAPGVHRLHVGLVADGVQWFDRSTHAYWDIAVADSYRAQWGGQSEVPTLASGQTATVTIAYKNTGSQTWTRGVVNLGTVTPDFSFSFDLHPNAASWIAPNRPALLNELSVAPGQVGTFTFLVSNPGLAPGIRRLDVGLVADGVQWFDRTTHAYWDVRTQ
jgi:thermitase